ncbi:MAG: quinolinate synthase NadA [Nitrososphaerales archaeon]
MHTESVQDKINEIFRLKKEKNAVILSHNYQIPDIQDLADFVGDSLGLSHAAARTDAEVIVFCGVHFMAETAAIICPSKKVLIPDLNAGCSLAATMTAQQLMDLRRKYPESVIVSYINTSAEVKAQSDYCCTSTNAVKVVNAIPADKEIIFVPDMFLGAYVQSVTGRKLHLWPGECHVHAGIKPKDVVSMKEKHPDAEFLVHPECGCVSSFLYHIGEGDIPETDAKVFSTEGMMRYAKQSQSKQFVIATETEIIHRLKKENPNKDFFPIKDDAFCKYMKMITLDGLLKSLREMVYEVKIPEPIAGKARVAIDRMMSLA